MQFFQTKLIDPCNEHVFHLYIFGFAYIQSGPLTVLFNLDLLVAVLLAPLVVLQEDLNICTLDPLAVLQEDRQNYYKYKEI